MCGIAGIWNADNPDRAKLAVRRMAAAMARRGPDHEGFWTSPDRALHLGFRRLAILDRSSAGHQPMMSSDGTSVVVFNGELYNFAELKGELEGAGVSFRSRSDTEVVVEALRRWGRDALRRFNGMFGLAWYDLKERRLLLARDHAGIKPLYYARPPGGAFAFASQLDALLAVPGLDPDALDLAVVHLFLRLHHIPPPFSLVRHTHQLAPGHWLEVVADGRMQTAAWWQLPRSPSPDTRKPVTLDELEATLGAAVKRQLVADVPVGVFLSGGVDSPLVAALAASISTRPLTAHTIGNPGWAQDESSDASTYARHLHLEHRLHAVSSERALAALPEVIAAQHEPLGDFSIIPTMLVSAFARETVTVALSGDGGDELFFGYVRPLSLLRNGRDFRWPWLVRLALYACGKLGLGSPRSEVIASRTPGDYYFNVNCRITETQLRELAPMLPRLPDEFDLYRSGPYRGLHDLADYSRYVEFYGQLQRGLKKVDMGAMHHSLEVRVPFLDREVIDLSLRIDPFELMRSGRRKAHLEDLLARRVPRRAIHPQKRGFAIPLGQWLRGAWRDAVEDTLFGSRSRASDLFDRRRLRQYVDEHVVGHLDRKWGLWTILALEWWRSRVRLQHSARQERART